MTSSSPPPPGRHPDEVSPTRLRRWDDEPRIPERRSPGRSFGGTLFTEAVLIVSRRAEIVETSEEYSVFDRDGARVGGVADVSQGFLHKAARLLPKYDQYVTHKFEVRDANHSTVLKVARPAKELRTRFIVTRADETPIGEIVPTRAPGDTRFTFVVDGRTVGHVATAGPLPWDVTIKNHADTEVARVSRPRSAPSPITGDTYLVEIPRQLPEPLASMVVATTLTIDTALTRETA
ncbi:scramblase [Amycolatopsis rhabdoformis]|uniref:Scramblase n=1 Tax=Amycolatopsis rhabdoformis TaxID=1448059 RepID=A0ABZ1I8F7_9PSEU|nr:scramblase [Amycolatopsis rhabdoformis]WSE30168.1 scramblase [Amycolatopsis rhabdoformis]